MAAFGSVEGDANFDARPDHNDDGAVTTLDFGTFLRFFQAAYDDAEQVGHLPIDPALVEALELE